MVVGDELWSVLVRDDVMNADALAMTFLLVTASLRSGRGSLSDRHSRLAAASR